MGWFELFSEAKAGTVSHFKAHIKFFAKDWQTLNWYLVV